MAVEDKRFGITKPQHTTSVDFLNKTFSSSPSNGVSDPASTGDLQKVLEESGILKTNGKAVSFTKDDIIESLISSLGLDPNSDISIGLSRRINLLEALHIDRLISQGTSLFNGVFNNPVFCCIADLLNGKSCGPKFNASFLLSAIISASYLEGCSNDMFDAMVGKIADRELRKMLGILVMEDASNHGHVDYLIDVMRHPSSEGLGVYIPNLVRNLGKNLTMQYPSRRSYDVMVKEFNEGLSNISPEWKDLSTRHNLSIGKSSKTFIQLTRDNLGNADTSSAQSSADIPVVTDKESGYILSQISGVRTLIEHNYLDASIGKIQGLPSDTDVDISSIAKSTTGDKSSDVDMASVLILNDPERTDKTNECLYV